MTLTRLLRKIHSLVVVCLAIMSVATHLRAQQRILWQGAVKPDQINVYASASTRDRATAMLRQGELVDVILEINDMGGSWCRIAFSGQPEPLGYVPCLNLEQSHLAPKHVAYTEPVATQPHVQAPVTPATQKLSEAAVVSPAVLTNKDILDMKKIGLPPEILLAKIKSSQSNFDTSPASLQALKTAGVGDTVILAMVEAPMGQPKPSMVADPPYVASTPVSLSPAMVPSDGKTRVFVTDSQSWETRGGGAAGGNKHGWSGSSWIAGGARPQTAEIIKTLNQRCPQLTVTNNLDKADFVLTLDHEGGKALLAHRNKIAVFNKDGDDIFSRSTIALGNAVKDACQAMLSAKK